MAEYFPLLERAVAGLADSTPEARRAIYERARAALLGQLRRMDPPIPEADIARESAALDDAVGRIEATFRQTEAPPTTPVAQSLVTPAPATPRPAPLFASRAAPAARPPGLPSGVAPPVLIPPARPRPVLGPRPAGDGTLSQPTPPRRPAPDSPATETAAPAVVRPQVSMRPLNPASRIGLEPRGINPLRQPPAALTPAAATPRPAPAAPDVGATGPLRAADPPEPEPAIAVVGPPDAAAVARRMPEEKRRRGAVFYLGLTVMALLAGAVGYEAWMLRDSPEEVMAAQQSGSLDQDGKVVERASGQEDAPAQIPMTDATALPAPLASQSPSAAPPSTSTPSAAGPAEPQGNPTAPVADNAAAPVSPTPAPTPAPVTATTPTASPSPDLSPSPSVGVAERAALLVVAPDDPQKVKSYSGSVVWKSESVTSGQGQPLSQAVVADVTIPDAKLTMSMVMRRNTEPQLLASHTIELRFTNEPGSDIGAIKQIDVPQMRLDGSQTGDPLTGLTVAITDNNFLVGLSRGDAEAANTLMLQKRNWIDLPLLLASGKPAKITFEKGVPGQHIIDEAIKSWKAGG